MASHTLQSLAAAMRKDLEACRTEGERINVRAICGREIREKAWKIEESRKLTDGETQILESTY
jgi:hypothetical protein